MALGLPPAWVPLGPPSASAPSADREARSALSCPFTELEEDGGPTLANSQLLLGSRTGDLDVMARALGMGADIETRGAAAHLCRSPSEALASDLDGGVPLPEDGTDFEEVVVLGDQGHFQPQGEISSCGPTKYDSRSLTPLIHAARAGHAEAVDFLLQQGANPHAQDGEGMTPLHHAAAAGSSKACAALLRAGANRWVWDDNGRDAFACLPREAKSLPESQAQWAKLLRPVPLPGNMLPTVTPGASQLDFAWKPPKQRLVQ